jgi:hypothetical protein
MQAVPAGNARQSRGQIAVRQVALTAATRRLGAPFEHLGRHESSVSARAKRGPRGPRRALRRHGAAVIRPLYSSIATGSGPALSLVLTFSPQHLADRGSGDDPSPANRRVRRHRGLRQPPASLLHPRRPHAHRRRATAPITTRRIANVSTEARQLQTSRAELGGNPFPEPLASLVWKGLEAVLSYLCSLQAFPVAPASGSSRAAIGWRVLAGTLTAGAATTTTNAADP